MEKLGKTTGRTPLASAAAALALTFAAGCGAKDGQGTSNGPAAGGGIVGESRTPGSAVGGSTPDVFGAVAPTLSMNDLRPDAPAVGFDCNGDAIADLAVPSAPLPETNEWPACEMFRGQTFAPLGTIEARPGRALSLAAPKVRVNVRGAVDFDRDARLEFLAIERSPDVNRIRILTTELATEHTIDFGPHPIRVRFGDLDGNGNPDIVVTEDLPDARGRVRVFRGPLHEVAFDSGPLEGRIEGFPFDVDGDMVPELAIDTAIAGRADRGSVAFHDGRDFAARGTITAALGHELDVAGAPTHLELRGAQDLDADGQNELVSIEHADAPFITVHTRDLRGERTIQFPLGSAISAVVRDLDGDQRGDVIVTHRLPDEARSRVRVYRGRDLEEVYTSAPFAGAVGSAFDLDGDAIGELLIATPGHLRFLSGHTFDPEGELVARPGHTLEVRGAETHYGLEGASDLDHDGWPELAVVERGTDATVRVYDRLLRPDGEWTYTSPDVGLALADLDGDAAADLIVTDTADRLVTVIR